MVSDTATARTYDVLAPEYDDDSHLTTRSLERASVLAFRQAVHAGSLDRRCRSVIEVGCGTGVLTNELLDLRSVEHVEASDPSAQMLVVAARRTAPHLTPDRSLVLKRASALEALHSGHMADLVAGSLSDPFLDRRVSEALLSRLMPGGRAFFSVPSHRWAVRERTERLHLPTSITRFRTADGRKHFAKSQTYDPDQLIRLFESPGLRLVSSGVSSAVVGAGPTSTEVAWIMVRRLSVEDLQIGGDAPHIGQHRDETFR